MNSILLLRITLRNKGQAAVELTVFGFLIVVAFSVLMMYGQQLAMQQQMKMEAFRRAIKMAYEKNSSVTYTLKKDTRFTDIMGGFGKGQATAIGGSASVMWQKGIPGPSEEKSSKYSQYGYYIVNDVPLGGADGLPRYAKEVKGFDGSEQTVSVPVSIWKEDSVRTEIYNTSTIRSETKPDRRNRAPSKITNKKIARLQDTLTTNIYLRQDVSVPPDAWTVPPPVYQYLGNVSSTQGAVLAGPRPTIEDGEGKEKMTKYKGAGATDPGRVAYSTSGVGNTIYREREWQTDVSQEN